MNPVLSMKSCRLLIVYLEKDFSFACIPASNQKMRERLENCNSCNLIAPSNPRLTPIEPLISKVSFESIVCDYFRFKGWNCFVAADRTKKNQIKYK